MNKGERTKLTILEQGMKFCSKFGLNDITIGKIADVCQMSRTGVISHFKNKQDMQLAILKYSEEQFIEKVVLPAKDSDQLTYLQNMLDCWLNWTVTMFDKHNIGCPFIKGVVEYQNREQCAVKELAIEQQSRLLACLTRRVQGCIDQGYFTQVIDPRSIAYEIYSLYLGHAIIRNSPHMDNMDLEFKASISRLMARYQSK